MLLSPCPQLVKSQRKIIDAANGRPTRKRLKILPQNIRAAEFHVGFPCRNSIVDLCIERAVSRDFPAPESIGGDKIKCTLPAPGKAVPEVFENIRSADANVEAVLGNADLPFVARGFGEGIVAQYPQFGMVAVTHFDAPAVDRQFLRGVAADAPACSGGDGLTAVRGGMDIDDFFGSKKVLVGVVKNIDIPVQLPLMHPRKPASQTVTCCGLM